MRKSPSISDSGDAQKGFKFLKLPNRTFSMLVYGKFGLLDPKLGTISRPLPRLRKIVSFEEDTIKIIKNYIHLYLETMKDSLE